MQIELELTGPPHFRVGWVPDIRALYFAIIYRTTTPGWVWLRTWHLRPRWRPLRKEVQGFVNVEE